MITYAEALEIIQQHTPLLSTEVRSLDNLPGSILAEPILAPHDMPLFDNSAVDGYGVRCKDVAGASEQAVALDLQGTIQAGDSGDIVPLDTGQTVKILTGAPVPHGVEAVVMQEYTQSENGLLTVQKSVKPGDNIRRRGEEFQQGEEVLPANRLVTPAVAGLLASLGFTSATVYRQPKVAVVVTGNELIPPGQTLMPGQIYESNSYSLMAALKALGCDTITVQCVADSLEETRKILDAALQQVDVLITSGGVSVGEFDWVKEAAQSLGVTQHFWKVAIKPGKPVFFGSLSSTKGKKLIFGLPGNPVAVLLTFYLLVKPALQNMQGLMHNTTTELLKARLLKDIAKQPGRLDFVRGQLGRDEKGLTVMPTTGQGSHMLSGLAQADCLLPFSLEDSTLAAGSWVDVIPLQWCPF